MLAWVIAIATWLPPERPPQIRVGRKNSEIFLALTVYISKTVADTAKVTISD